MKIAAKIYFWRRNNHLRHNELTIDPYAKQATEETSYERYEKIIKTMKLHSYENRKN